MSPSPDEIGDAEVLYRRIPSLQHTDFVEVDRVTGVARLLGAAFRVTGDGCSMYRHDVLVAAGLGAQDIAKAPHNRVARLVTGEVRGLGLDVIADPWPEGMQTHARDAAHALVTEPPGSSKLVRAQNRQSLAARAVLVL